MDQTLNQLNQDKNIPTPPPLEIDVRTMESDIKAFQEKGGEVSETGMKSEFVAPKEDVFGNIQISGYSGPEKAIFSPSSDILSQQSQSQSTGMSSNAKLVLIIIGILIGAAGLGLLGYYVIFPIIFK